MAAPEGIQARSCGSPPAWTRARRLEIAPSVIVGTGCTRPAVPRHPYPAVPGVPAPRLSPSRAAVRIPTPASGRNSVGRVSASQAECRGFEPHHPLLSLDEIVFPAWRENDENEGFLPHHLGVGSLTFYPKGTGGGTASPSSARVPFGAWRSPRLEGRCADSDPLRRSIAGVSDALSEKTSREDCVFGAAPFRSARA